MRAVRWVVEEFRKVRVAFFFFTGLFAVIVVSDHILGRASSDVLVPNFARAAIGGLIAAKALLIVDHMRITERYKERPLAYSIVWKAALYFVSAQLIMALEPTVRALFHEGLSAAAQALVEHFQQPRIWAISLWMVFLVLGFVTLRELSRAVGPRNIRKLMWGR